MKRPCDICPVKGKFGDIDQTCSISDQTDHLPLTCVGEWALDKHKRLRKYVDITWPIRKKFVNGLGGATYIELFSGPGKSRLKNSTEVIDGSALCAGLKAVDTAYPFTCLYLGDKKRDFLDAAKSRLAKHEIESKAYEGSAENTISRIVNDLNPHGLHFAFLDPYNLAAMPFSIIEELSKLKRIDILIHVSINDLQRNLRLYMSSTDTPLDKFAPGWRSNISENVPEREIRQQILQYWLSKIRSLGLETQDETIEKVTGRKNQPLYFLVFAAREKLANDFWDKIRKIDPQKGFDF